MPAKQRDYSTPAGDWVHGVVETSGAQLHFVREGGGPPVFLLHGWPEFWWSWHRNIPSLASEFDVIAPDLRGFGESKATGDTGAAAGLDAHTKDVVELADRLGIGKFGLLSHDVGAYIAQNVARAYPERVAGLFFLNCPYPGIGRRWVDADHVREIWYQSFNQLPWASALVGQNRETCRLYFENMLSHWAHAPGAFDGQIDHFVDNFMRPGNIEGGFAWYAATHAARMALVRDGAPNLPKIEAPSRFYWGQRDPIILADWTDKLPDYFVDPEVEIAEGAGHFVHFEVPDQVNPRVRAFFQTIFTA